MKPTKIILIVFLLINLWAISLGQVQAFGLKELKPDELDYTFQYTHFSKNRLVVNGYSFYDFLIIGDLEVKEVKNDMAVSTITARYQLTPDINFDLKLPFKYRNENVLGYTDKDNDNDISEVDKNNFGLGDVELTLSKQNTDLEDRNSALSMSIKTITGADPYDLGENDAPLGSGHYALKFDYTQMKSLDPVMLFGDISYSLNFERDVNAGLVDPGNTFEYSVGVAYALSNRVSFNSRFEQSFTGPTKIDGKKEKGSDYTEANIYFGLNYLNQSDISYEYVVGIGLTEDSPDFSFAISRPLNF